MTRTLKPSALKRYRDTFKDDGVVLPHLERHFMRQVAVAEAARERHCLHPSEMSSPEWCGRHDYYRIMDTPIDKESAANPSFRMNNALAEGHTIHDKYQKWLWELGVLYGMFHCDHCTNTWKGLSPESCPRCESRNLQYWEVPLRRDRYFMAGHADGAIHDLDGWTGLLEVKSIGLGTIRFEAPRMYQRYLDGNETLESLWWKINRPFGVHIKQGQLYLWLAWPRYERIVFIYESKFNQDSKEFVVEYNPSLIAPILETAKEVSQCLRQGMVPDRPVWADHHEAKNCKSCEYRSTCWDLIIPKEQESGTKVTVQRTDSKRRKRALANP